MFVLVSLAVSQAGAQQKPPPPTVEQQTVAAPNIEMWADAYQQYGAPEILVFCGWSNGDPHSAASSSDYLALDESSFTVQLQGAFIDIINDPRADIFLVDNGALSDAIGRLESNLLNSTETEGVLLLANEVKADLVVQIQLIDRKPNGAPNRVRFQTVNVTNGRTLTTKVFDWKLGTSTKDVKLYAEQIARVFIEDIAARAINTQSYNLRFFGFASDAQLPKLVKDSVSAIRGIRSVRSRTSSSVRNPWTGESETMTRFTVRYTGDFLDLSADVARSLNLIGDSKVRIMEAAGRDLTLQVYSEADEHYVPDDSFETCLRIILDQSKVGQEYRDRLFELYKKQDSPRVSVLVNRQPTKEEREQAIRDGDVLTTTANTMVIVNTTGRDMISLNNQKLGTQRNDLATSSFRRITLLERQTNLVESAMYKALGPELLRFERRDTSAVWDELMRQSGRSAGVIGQDEVVEAFRKLDIADIIIVGTGADLVDVNGEVSVTYTFKAIQLADASVVAVASALEGLRGQGSEFDVANSIVEQAIVGLACEMKKFWEPPTRLELSLINIADADDLELLLQTIESRAERVAASEHTVRVIGRVSYESDQKSGTAKFTLSYGCTFNELLSELSALSGELPFELEIQSMDSNRAQININY